MCHMIHFYIVSAGASGLQIGWSDGAVSSGQPGTQESQWKRCLNPGTRKSLKHLLFKIRARDISSPWISTVCPNQISAYNKDVNVG